MILGEEKTRRYYRLLAGLGNYANQKWKITPGFQGDNYGEGDGSEFKARAKIVGAIWEHPEIIDEYLNADGSDLTTEDRETISSWNRFIQGTFVLVRDLKSGGVLFSIENAGEIYLVQNFMYSWTELANMFGLRLPTFVQARLLPYDGVIVADGFTAFSHYTLGTSVLRIFKEDYLEQKAAGKIHRTL